MSEEAKTAVRSEFHFVRAQLQHYGIEFSQSGFSGNGVAILKEALRAGKVRIRRPRCNGRLLTLMQCDQVPNSVLLLKSQMHKEWLRKCRDKDLAKYPMYLLPVDLGKVLYGFPESCGALQDKGGRGTTSIPQRRGLERD